MNRRRIGRRCAVENLLEVRERRANFVAGETRDADAARHAEQSAQGHATVLVEIVGGDAPGGEPRAHLRIERDLPGIDKAQRAGRSHELGERRRLKQCLGRRAVAVSAHESDFVCVDQRKADRRYVQDRHRLFEADQWPRASVSRSCSMAEGSIARAVPAAMTDTPRPSSSPASRRE